MLTGEEEVEAGGSGRAERKRAVAANRSASGQGLGELPLTAT
jgi:hypothetical protein